MWLDIYLVMIIGLCLINFDQCIHIPCMNHQNIENPFKMTIYLYHIIITIPPAEVSQTIVHSWFVHYWLPPDSLFLLYPFPVKCISINRIRLCHTIWQNHFLFLDTTLIIFVFFLISFISWYYNIISQEQLTNFIRIEKISNQKKNHYIHALTFGCNICSFLIHFTHFTTYIHIICFYPFSISISSN